MKNTEMTETRISGSELTDDPGDLGLGHLDRRLPVTVGNVQLAAGLDQELTYLNLGLFAAVVQG